METHSSGNTDLASILRTLAAYGPPPSSKPEPDPLLEEGEYDPSEYSPAQSLASPQKQAQSGPPVQQSSTQIHSTPPLAASTTPVPKDEKRPSAASITTWPKALNYTINHICSDPHKRHRIRHLIQMQQSHEKQWWTARQELIRKSQNRGESRMRLDSVL